MPPSPLATPFYLDWTFWTAVVAVAALVLSQLAPVRVWFRGARVRLQPYDRLTVTHYLGQPSVTLHVQFTNTGGRAARVVSLVLEVTREDGVRARSRRRTSRLTPANVAPLTAFFRARRFWQAGEYIATCDPAGASLTLRFRFTLFESDAQDLDEREARYKYGAGVYFNDPTEVAVNPRIRGGHVAS